MTIIANAWPSRSLAVPPVLTALPARILWTRFCNSGCLLHGISLTGFVGCSEAQFFKTPMTIVAILERGDCRAHFLDIDIVAVKSTVTQLVYKHAISTIVPIDGEVVQPNQEKRNAVRPNVVVRSKPSKRLV